MNGRSTSRGTGLIEAVVATSIVAMAMGVLASLSSVALHSLAVGRERSLAVVFAQSKLDELHASPMPAVRSPADSLDRDAEGWYERLDAAGLVAGVDTDHAGTVFVRRWRVQPVAGSVTLSILAVRVGRCRMTTATSAGCQVSSDAVVVAAVRSESAW
jgi:Tfp pilus assembly protein PilV